MNTLIYKMSFQLIKLQTDDGVIVQYPLKALVRSCELIRDIHGTPDCSMDDIIQISMKSTRLCLFLELLETRKALATNEDTVESLHAACYFGLNLKERELNEILCASNLDNIDEGHVFLAQKGFNKITIPAVIYLLSHKDELAKEARPSMYEKVKETIAKLEGTDKISIRDALLMYMSNYPLNIRMVLQDVVKRFNHEEISVSEMMILKKVCGPMAAVYFDRENEDDNISKLTTAIMELYAAGAFSGFRAQVHNNVVVGNAGPVGNAGQVGALGPILAGIQGPRGNVGNVGPRGNVGNVGPGPYVVGPVNPAQVNNYPPMYDE